MKPVNYAHGADSIHHRAAVSARKFPPRHDPAANCYDPVMNRKRILRLFVTAAIYGALAGCLSPTPWWEKELNAWVGADAQEVERLWGPPARTIVGKSGRPVMVYESHTTIDRRKDTLRDPSRMVSADAPDPGAAIEDFDCQMYFELENDQVVAVSHEGAGCQVIPRPGKSPRS